MKFSAYFATTLLLLPGLIGAAPTTQDTQDISAGTLVVRFDRTCNEPVPKKGKTDAEKKAYKKWETLKSQMGKATSDAHKEEDKCPSPKTYNEYAKLVNKGNEEKKNKIRQKCIDAWKQSAKKRTEANSACQAMGGTVDAGHVKSVTFANNESHLWTQEKVLKA